MSVASFIFLFICFIFNEPPTTYIYTLSLHDALPILIVSGSDHLTAYNVYAEAVNKHGYLGEVYGLPRQLLDRKSTRLNSSHRCISYAVFCLKKKNIDR